jgi:hypothetical protein
MFLVYKKLVDHLFTLSDFILLIKIFIELNLCQNLSYLPYLLSSSGQMYQWPNVSVAKCTSGEMSSGQMY